MIKDFFFYYIALRSAARGGELKRKSFLEITLCDFRGVQNEKERYN